MAIMSVWSEVESLHYDKVASILVWELGIKTLFGIPLDSKVVEENEAKLDSILDVYEKRLSESKYMGGECFTLVDLHHVPSLHYLMKSQSKKLFESRPYVNAWVDDITARPAWSKVLAMIPN
jgi:glutathione S-transferase